MSRQNLHMMKNHSFFPSDIEKERGNCVLSFSLLSIETILLPTNVPRSHFVVKIRVYYFTKESVFFFIQGELELDLRSLKNEFTHLWSSVPKSLREISLCCVFFTWHQRCVLWSLRQFALDRFSDLWHLDKDPVIWTPDWREH